MERNAACRFRTPRKRQHLLLTLPRSPHPENILISKGFLQSEVLGKVYVLEGGGVRGEVFGKVRGEVFGEVSGLALLRHSEQKKVSARLQPEIPTALHSKRGESSWKNFSMTRFWREIPADMILAHNSVCWWVQQEHCCPQEVFGELVALERLNVQLCFGFALTGECDCHLGPGDHVMPEQCRDDSQVQLSSVRCAMGCRQGSALWDTNLDFTLSFIHTKHIQAILQLAVPKCKPL